MITCNVDGARLRELSPVKILPEYNKEWLDIIKERRRSGRQLLFHWIFGRCGDGVTDIVEQIRHESGDAALLKAITPERSKSTYFYDQFWFGTEESLTSLAILSYSIIKNDLQKNGGRN